MPELLIGQAGKIIFPKAADKEISRKNIIIFQCAIQGLVFQLSLVITNNTGVILPRVHGFNIAADKGLHSREGMLHNPFLRILSRLNI